MARLLLLIAVVLSSSSYVYSASVAGKEKGISFKGDGYVELPRHLMPHTDFNKTDTVIIEFSTTQKNGLLFWHGQTPNVNGSSKDHLSLAIADGHVSAEYEVALLTVTNTQMLQDVSDGKRYRVILKREGAFLGVEGEGYKVELGMTPPDNAHFDTPGNIYIGGLPNSTLMTGSSDLVGFNGCIHSLQLDNTQVDFSETDIKHNNSYRCSG